MEPESKDPKQMLQSLAGEINIVERTEKQHEAGIEMIHSQNKSTKKIIFKMLLGILGLLIIAVIILLVLVMMDNKKDKNSDDNQSEDNPSVTPTQIPESQTPENTSKKRIAYILEGNVWIMDNDGKGKIQITEDGDPENFSSIYSMVNWKSSDIVSFVKCPSTCTIYSYNISEGKLTEDYPVTEGTLLAYTWSPDAKTLAYYYQTLEGQRVLKAKNGAVKTFKMWDSEILGRGGSPEDNTSVQYSPDGKSLMLVYTIGLPGQETLNVFSEIGEEIVKIESEGFQDMATFGMWLNNSTILYKSDGKLFSRDITTDELQPQPVSDKTDFYDLRLSPNGKMIIGWDYEITGETNLWKIAIADGKKESVTTDFAQPLWIDNDVLIGYVSEPSDGFLPYTFTGIARVNVDGSEFQILVGENAGSFAVER